MHTLGVYDKPHMVVLQILHDIFDILERVYYWICILDIRTRGFKDYFN